MLNAKASNCVFVVSIECLSKPLFHTFVYSKFYETELMLRFTDRSRSTHRYSGAIYRHIACSMSPHVSPLAETNSLPIPQPQTTFCSALAIFSLTNTLEPYANNLKPRLQNKKRCHTNIQATAIHQQF